MTEKFVITGMPCAACAAHVERAAASVPGVHSASVNLMLGSLVCDGDENVDPAAIVAAVTAAGYGAVPESEARRICTRVSAPSSRASSPQVPAVSAQTITVSPAPARRCGVGSGQSAR